MRLFFLVFFALPSLFAISQEYISPEDIGVIWWDSLASMFGRQELTDAGITADITSILRGFDISFDDAFRTPQDLEAWSPVQGYGVSYFVSATNYDRAVNMEVRTFDSSVSDSLSGLVSFDSLAWSSVPWFDALSSSLDSSDVQWHAMRAVVPDWSAASVFSNSSLARMVAYQQLRPADLTVEHVIGWSTQAVSQFMPRHLSFQASASSPSVYSSILYPLMPTPLWYNSSSTGDYYIPASALLDNTGVSLGETISAIPSSVLVTNTVNLRSRLVVKDSLDLLQTFGLSASEE